LSFLGAGDFCRISLRALTAADGRMAHGHEKSRLLLLSGGSLSK
jgi:hypothetical protein